LKDNSLNINNNKRYSSFIQGLSGAVGIVIARAIARDVAK